MLIEAATMLAAISLGVRLLPFRRLAALAQTRVRGRPPADPLATILRVAWAVRAVARRARFRAVCIEQGLVAHLMLRRRGIGSTLFYGVARRDGELKAHVWVRWGEIDVIGCEIADEFTLVAQFPAAQTRDSALS